MRRQRRKQKSRKGYRKICCNVKEFLDSLSIFSSCRRKKNSHKKEEIPK